MTNLRWDASVKQRRAQQEQHYSPPFMTGNKEDAGTSVWLLAAVVERKAAFSAAGNLLSFRFECLICNGDQGKHFGAKVGTLWVRVEGWRLHYAGQSPHKDRNPALRASRSSPDQHHGQQSGSTKMALMGGNAESLEANYSRRSFSEQHECQKDQARNPPSQINA